MSSLPNAVHKKRSQPQARKKYCLIEKHKDYVIRAKAYQDMLKSSKLWAVKSSASWLPFELVEEILSRTQIEDLLRAKSICKEWYGLIKDTRFIYKHLDLSQETKKRFIRIYRDKVQIMNPVTQDLLCLPVPADFFGSRSENYKTILSAMPCDGLLLCRCGDGREKRMLAVWNPVLSNGGVKWIEPLTSYHCMDEYGFGYDNDKKYKILRFHPLGNEYEIYDFKSKHWKVFPATFDWLTIFAPCRKVSMKGNLYWIAKTKSISEYFIQSFDFSKETFKPICYSFPVHFRGFCLDALILSDFGGDRLSLLHQHKGMTKMEVWVTNKLSDGGVVVSWSKYFNVSCSDLPILPLRHKSHGDPTYLIHKTNGIMLWCDKVVEQEADDYYACASFCVIEDGEIKRQVETGLRFARKANTCIWGDVYVPSLVPVPECKKKVE